MDIDLLSTAPLIGKEQSSNHIGQECNGAIDTSQGKYCVRVDTQRFIKDRYGRLGDVRYFNREAYFGSTIK